jgi:hypothetical protein
MGLRPVLKYVNHDRIMHERERERFSHENECVWCAKEQYFDHVQQ